MTSSTFSDNLFREEVQDDIVFDLDSTFRGQTGGVKNEKAKVLGEGSRKGFGLDLSFLDNLQGIKGPVITTQPINIPNVNIPEITTPELPIISTQPVNLPNVNFNTPDIPKIDLNTESPDLQPAIDTVKDVFGEAVEKTKPVVDPIIETGKDILTDIGSGISEVVKPIAEPTRALIDSATQVVGDSLGLAKDQFENTKIRKGDGSGYGEISLGDTGAVLDVSDKLDQAFDEVTSGTPLEGVSGKDLHDVVSDPGQFVADKGIEVAKDFLSKNLGIDKGLVDDVTQAISNPEEFIKDKGIEAAADFVSKSTGRNASVAGLSTLIETGDLKAAGEQVAKSAATQATVQAVKAIGDTLLPGLGTAIEFIANIFQYSCYLSTSAYYNKYIDRSDYLLFTRYRIDIQSKEFLSEQTWLGYISLFEPKYNKLLNNKTIAKFVFKYVTTPCLRHVKYLLGKGKFSFTGCMVTHLLRASCLVSYVFNYKKCRIRKYKLKNVNIISIYTKIVRCIERERSYAR